MGALCHLSYKSANGGGVPSPVDGNPKALWPLDYWATQYPRMARAGVTVPLLPPLCKGASLGAGYDPFDHYDLGSKNQKGRRETRYGAVEHARRNVSIANRLGMDVAVNVVHHHLDGAANSTYQYLGADGKAKNGRFPKDRNCFWKQTKESPNNPDRVPNPQYDGGIWAYGDEFRWMSGTYGDGKGQHGPGYPGRELIKSLEWQLRTTGVKQLFWDDLKGTDPHYIAWAVNTLRSKGLINFAFGEFYEGSADILESWVQSYPIVRTCGVLDFTRRFALREWCLNPGNYDMRRLMRDSFCTRDPFNSVTFSEDADTNESGPIFQRSLQATAAICMLDGYPMLFGKEMWQIPGCYGQIGEILNLAWIHQKMANGPLLWRWEDRNFLVFERPWAPGLVGVLSNRDGSPSNPKAWTEVNVQTSWWPKTQVKDYSGQSTEIRTVDSRGRLTIPIPPSDQSGHGFAAWGQVGLDGPIHLPEIQTTQRIVGAMDLDTMPATTKGSYCTAIWPEPGREIRLNKLQGDGVRFEMRSPAGDVVISRGQWNGEARETGWHVIRAHVGDGEVPYDVDITYSGRDHLATSEIEKSPFVLPSLFAA